MTATGRRGGTPGRRGAAGLAACSLSRGQAVGQGRLGHCSLGCRVWTKPGPRAWWVGLQTSQKGRTRLGHRTWSLWNTHPKYHLRSSKDFLRGVQVTLRRDPRKAASRVGKELCSTGQQTSSETSASHIPLCLSFLNYKVGAGSLQQFLALKSPNR